MLIFSKLHPDALDTISSFLDIREIMPLYTALCTTKKQQIHFRLLTLSQNDNDILMIGDLLIYIYSHLNIYEKSGLYTRISALCKKFDHDLRQHFLRLSALLINKNLLTTTEIQETHAHIVALCNDNNHGVRMDALRIIFDIFPTLSQAHQTIFIDFLEKESENTLDLNLRKFFADFQEKYSLSKSYITR
ncbi:MAG: hypothetical protein RLZ35_1003 [Pseudomonadota bacterium]